ncbi:YceH family protein [Luteolibacter marinus]|uniref:YceH family protein n=1 Tax=Luteolibacter marinus TaxID=2776705 RepID=UPI00186642FA|nr:YceH family protein [Luteolibacter marinus]
MKHFPELQLTPAGARVLGCLLEKETLTPDQYPLTLNALVAACNQATSRFPVTNHTAGEVEEALRQLSDDYLVTRVLGGRAAKFEHNLPDVLSLTPAERAVFTVLLLRGTQTAGELKQRTERLHAFGDLGEVEEILTGFIEYPHGPLVERLPSGGGRRVETFRHLLCPVDGDEAAADAFDAGADWRQWVEQRFAALEAEVAELKARLGE